MTLDQHIDDVSAKALAAIQAIEAYGEAMQALAEAARGAVGLMTDEQREVLAFTPAHVKTVTGYLTTAQRGAQIAAAWSKGR
jgi:hypothetical protein